MNIMDTLNEVSSTFDLYMMKVGAVTEAAKRELSINYGEAELKVMTESGTADDLAFYYEEAEKSFKEKIIATIEKIKAALEKFFSEVKSKILDMINSVKTSEALEKIKQKLKIFPIMKNKQVVVENYPEQEKTCSKFWSQILKFKAKFKAGQTVDVEDLNKADKEFEDDHEKVVGVRAAVKMTIGNAVNLLEKLKADANNFINKNQREANELLDDCKTLGNAAKDLGSHAFATGVQKLAELAAKCKRWVQEDFVRILASLTKTIKEGLISAGTKVKEGADAAKAKASEVVANARAKRSNKNNKESDMDSDGTVANESVASRAYRELMSLFEDVDSDGQSPTDTASMQNPNKNIAGDPPQQQPVDECGDDFDSLFNNTFPDPLASLDASINSDLDECGKYCESFGSDTSYSWDSRPSDDTVIKNLFNDIMGSTRDEKDSQGKPLQESAFDELMKSIDLL